jgi:hypothetical protein
MGVIYGWEVENDTSWEITSEKCLLNEFTKRNTSNLYPT